MSLSVLCVTTGKPRADRFLEHYFDLGHALGAEVVIARDGKDVHSKGYIESVLDDAIALTHGDYVLRLDDDERCSPAMQRWLAERQYEAGDHWTFPRVHLWGDEKTAIMEPYYFPDLQTRLSVRAKAGGRPAMHSGSPWGAGTIARVAIEHWVYLVKSYEERCATGQFYKSVMEGGDGGQYRASSFEDEHPGEVTFFEYEEGEVPMRGRLWKGTCAEWRRPE